MGTYNLRGNSGKGHAYAGYYGRYYSAGSEAVKLGHDDYSESFNKKDSRKYYEKKVRLERPKRTTHNIFKAMCVFSVCLSAIVMVFAHSMVYNYQLGNEALVFELEKERKETDTIHALAAEKIDLAKVEEIARTKLFMSEPQPYQIVYVEVPKSDYTIEHGYQMVDQKETESRQAFKDFVETVKDSGELLGFQKAETKLEMPAE